MSRAVVVGPYPPTADPAGAISLDEVRALRAAGHDVVVISPEPSAARVTAPPYTRRGARRIAQLVRGADVVVWVGADPPASVARALGSVADVRIVAAPVATPSARDLAEQMELVRAGGPTFVRSLRRRRR